MTNDSLPAEPDLSPRRWHLDLIPQVLVRPRRALARIAGLGHDSWLTPMALLTVTALLAVVVAGPLRKAEVLSGEVTLPPGFEYYSPEQQAQFYQAQQARAGDTFVYVFPALGGVARVWTGWLVTASLLHLGLTLFGVRGTLRLALSRVAWAGLPFAVRDLVRVGYLLVGRRLIAAPGLSGLMASPEGFGAQLAVEILSLIDLYLAWHVILLVLGVRAESDPGPRKAWASVLLTEALLLLVQAAPAAGVAQLASLTIIRPFLF